jgi:hypothetical protein
VKNFFVTIFFALLLTACTGKPSDSEIEEQVLASLVNVVSRDFLAVHSLKKLNGFEKDSSTYIAVVKFEAEFKKSFQEVSDALTSLPANPIEAMQLALGVKVLKMQYGNFAAGQKMEITREFTFINTDNGWVLAD